MHPHPESSPDLISSPSAPERPHERQSMTAAGWYLDIGQLLAAKLGVSEIGSGRALAKGMFLEFVLKGGGTYTQIDQRI